MSKSPVKKFICGVTHCFNLSRSNASRVCEMHYYRALRADRGVSVLSEVHEASIRRKFAVSYSELFNESNGVCGICHKPCSDGKRLAVDHCHKTGKVRGLLCRVCNVQLGVYERRHKEFSDYLKKAGNL